MQSRWLATQIYHYLGEFMCDAQTSCVCASHVATAPQIQQGIPTKRDGLSDRNLDSPGRKPFSGSLFGLRGSCATGTPQGTRAHRRCADLRSVEAVLAGMALNS